MKWFLFGFGVFIANALVTVLIAFAVADWHGTEGPQGLPGPSGPPGIAGPAGPQGVQGLRGADANDGGLGQQVWRATNELADLWALEHVSQMLNKSVTSSDPQVQACRRFITEGSGSITDCGRGFFRSGAGQ